MNSIVATVTEAPDRSMIRGADIGRVEGAVLLRSGRSWWQVRYESGKILSEWKTLQGVRLFLPIGPSSTSRWEDIPKKGIRGLYLFCPNGQIAALESNGDYQFFQFKIGGTVVGGDRFCEAHLIGKVDNDNGGCVCWAWEYQEQRLVRFEDNVSAMKYRNVGAVSLGQHTGIL